MFDCDAIENSFDDLMTAFSNQAALDFSSCLFSSGQNISNSLESFEKYIYTKGDQQEIYTKQERLFIESVPQYCICSEFYLFENRQRITCRLIAIDLKESISLVYDSIAIMKICNKALDGFNVYILVGSDAVHIGCDVIGDASKTACAISYPIMKTINWDFLLYTFLEIVEDKGFLNYYRSLIESIAAIHTCYTEQGNSYDSLNSVNMDDYYEERWYNVSDENLYQDAPENEDDVINHMSCFLSDVKNAKFDLSFITTNRINPLEMLFDAEIQAERAAKVQENIKSTTEENEIQNEELSSLLSDPEKLIKALKNKKKEQFAED